MPGGDTVYRLSLHQSNLHPLKASLLTYICHDTHKTSSFRTPIISLHPNSMAQSYKSSMLASGLDVAARSIDLVTALVNASNATGPCWCPDMCLAMARKGQDGPV
jgi:hypothetical protein